MPEQALPSSPHCQALAQPWTLSSTCLPAHGEGRAGPSPLPPSFLPPASSLTPSPSGQDQSVCVCQRVGGSGESVQRQGVGVQWSLLPMVWGAISILPMQSICLCGRLAGLGICLSVCCWCAYAWGRSAGAPPHMALALSMQEPQSSHFVRVFWPCGSVCVCLCVRSCTCVCFLVLWPVCLCAYVTALWPL